MIVIPPWHYSIVILHTVSYQGLHTTPLSPAEAHRQWAPEEAHRQWAQYPIVSRKNAQYPTVSCKSALYPTVSSKSAQYYTVSYYPHPLSLIIPTFMQLNYSSSKNIWFTILDRFV